MNPYRLGSVAPHVYPGRVPFIGWRATILSLLLGAVVACGGGWADADTKSAADAVRDEMALERLCADTSDTAQCKASQVRALQRASRCANASMLARHGQQVPVGGDTGCKP